MALISILQTRSCLADRPKVSVKNGSAKWCQPCCVGCISDQANSCDHTAASAAIDGLYSFCASMRAAANTRAMATDWNPPSRFPVFFAIDPMIDKEKKEPRLPKELMNASADAAERPPRNSPAQAQNGPRKLASPRATAHHVATR